MGEPVLADPRGWLLEQVRPDAAALPDGTLPTATDVGKANRALIEAQRTERLEAFLDRWFAPDTQEKLRAAMEKFARG